VHSLLVTCISPHEAVVYTVRIRRAWDVSPEHITRSKPSIKHHTTEVKPRPILSHVLAITPTNVKHNRTWAHQATRYKSRQNYQLEEPSPYSALLSPLPHNHQHVFPPPHIYPGTPEALHYLNTCSQCHLHGRCRRSTDDIHPWCECRPKARKGSTMVRLSLYMIPITTNNDQVSPDHGGGSHWYDLPSQDRITASPTPYAR